mgnify:CR=1 FL=1
MNFDKYICFRNQNLHYGFEIVGDEFVRFDFGDGELKDEDDDNYFIHVEHHLDTDEWVFEYWYEHDVLEAVDITASERMEIIDFVNRNCKERD